MSAVVEMSIKYHVDPFLDTIKALVAADGTDPNKDLKIGDFTLTDLQRSVSSLLLPTCYLGESLTWQIQQTYSAVVVIRSYFAVFGDIAKTWTHISSKCIMPGLKHCDDLSVTVDDKHPGQMQEKLKTLDSWSREASEAVAKIASEVCEMASSDTS